MPLSGEALNEQGNAITRGTKPTNQTSWVTVASSTSQSPEESTAPSKKVKKTAHGFETGQIVIWTKLNAAATLGEVVGGLVVGAPYYVFKINANEFALAYTKAQAEAGEGECIEFTTTIKAESVIHKILEHTGAKTHRIATGFSAAVNLANEDATAREVVISSTVTIKWLMYWSAETNGTHMGTERTKNAEGVPNEKSVEAEDIIRITKDVIAQNAYIQ